MSTFFVEFKKVFQEQQQEEQQQQQQNKPFLRPRQRILAVKEIISNFQEYRLQKYTENGR